MSRSANGLRWTGQPGHYEVYYLTLTDPSTDVGVWIRYTMLAPLAGRGEQPTCALWFLMMDPRPEAQHATLARKATFGIDQLHAREDPFSLDLAGANLTDGAMAGSLQDAWWDLRWVPAPRPHQPVHPALERLRVAQTVLVLPHADVAIEGALGIGERRIDLVGARGGQAHLWGSKHATSWAWAHCNDLLTADGEPAPGIFFDGVSVVVTRFGRRVGPNTPVVGQFGERQLRSTSFLRILGNRSRFTIDGWEFEAGDGSLKVVGTVSARREQLAGVTYHDPDGEEAYCYNSETASVRLDVYERSPRTRAWAHAGTYTSAGRCHFEYAQRTPVPGLELPHEMTLPAPFEEWGEHLAITLAGARVLFTTRRGGFSQGPFESLNLGKLTADQPEAVDRNRELIREQVGRRLAMVHQVHGATVRRAETIPDVPDLVKGDGIVTTGAELAPAVLVADCLPVAVAGAGTVAMLHAGWRGLADGILAAGVGAVREHATADGPLDAAIGPGIRSCCYEVGEEVHEFFSAYGPGVRRGNNLDLAAVARAQLQQAGVEVVHDAGWCTACHPELFFSHRRDHGITGRQAGIAWLT